jgi:hypothetical protein
MNAEARSNLILRPLTKEDTAGNLAREAHISEATLYR